MPVWHNFRHHSAVNTPNLQPFGRALAAADDG